MIFAVFPQVAHFVELTTHSILNELFYFLAQMNRLDVELSMHYRVELDVEVDVGRLLY